jgi:hypothetical protein
LVGLSRLFDTVGWSSAQLGGCRESMDRLTHPSG